MQFNTERESQQNIAQKNYHNPIDRQNEVVPQTQHIVVPVIQRPHVAGIKGEGSGQLVHAQDSYVEKEYNMLKPRPASKLGFCNIPGA